MWTIAGVLEPVDVRNYAAEFEMLLERVSIDPRSCEVVRGAGDA
jgi:hypothetical protein